MSLSGEEKDTITAYLTGLDNSRQATSQLSRGKLVYVYGAIQHWQQ